MLKDFKVLEDLKTLKVTKQYIWVTRTKSIPFDLFILSFSLFQPNCLRLCLYMAVQFPYAHSLPGLIKLVSCFLFLPAQRQFWRLLFLTHIINQVLSWQAFLLGMVLHICQTCLTSFTLANPKLLPSFYFFSLLPSLPSFPSLVFQADGVEIGNNNDKLMIARIQGVLTICQALI